MATSPYSRRRFLHQLLGAGTWAAAGLRPLPAQTAGSPEPFRFAFLTDLHLMEEGALRSAEGIAACLAAVENLRPRPDFILVGGDLVNLSRDLTITEAEKRLTFFLKIWHDHTSLPAHWVFGNHDLVATNNTGQSITDPHWGKGLFRDRFQLPHLYYSFDHKGWHFVVLDDIGLPPSHQYNGELSTENLAYLRADLDTHRNAPTILCTHIPILSNISMAIHMLQATGIQVNAPRTLVCANGGELTADLPGHNIRAVLSGHIHYYEKIESNGVSFINSGAVCGDYWKGPLLDCHEGFGVVDLAADGNVQFEYRTYGWKA